MQEGRQHEVLVTVADLQLVRSLEASPQLGAAGVGQLEDAALHHDNQALCEHLDSRTGKIVDLTTRREERRDGPVIGPC
ncbi:hypothetical protein [Actinoallomurus sp. CA-142502]|uniref:hypothetical protein n=1 Tax=Actinoallomurus sp. CA-142502 TaxID=3239885 RepID=UPI003D925DF4